MKEVTFVISGIFNEQTQLCANSIKKFFPNSPIVLSTWMGAVIPPGIFDKVILLQDPGNYGDNPNGSHVNLYRMIHSVSQGIGVVDTKYAVRIRPDFHFSSSNLKLLSLTESQNNFFKIFNKRIIALNLFFRNPKYYPALYHVGDMFHFGLTVDLLSLWKIDYLPIDVICKKKKYPGDLLKSISYRYFSEQYIWILCLRKFGFKPYIRYQNDINKADLQLSESSLAENFDIYTAKSLGLIMPSKFTEDDSSVYSMSDFYNIREGRKSSFQVWMFLLKLKKIRRYIKCLIGFK